MDWDLVVADVSPFLERSEEIAMLTRENVLGLLKACLSGEAEGLPIVNVESPLVEQQPRCLGIWNDLDPVDGCRLIAAVQKSGACRILLERSESPE